MHKKFRLLFALILALSAAIGVGADSSDRVFCGDLAPTDCQLLRDSAAAMDMLNALAFDATMTMRIDFGEPMNLAGRVHGAFEFDDEALQAMEDMSADLAAADLNALVDLALTSAKAKLSIQMSGAADDEPFELALDIQLKDGVLLIGAEALEAMTGESMEGLEGFGIDLNGALDAVLAEAGYAPTMDAGEHSLDDSAMKEAEAAAMSVVRLADSEINDVAVAVFEHDIDVNALMSMAAVEQMVAASGGFENEQSMDELLDLIDFRQLKAREYIGLDDRYAYRIDMLIDVTMAPGEGDQALAGALVMDMRVDLSDFNQPVEVEIPEDIFVLPLAMMMQMSEQ